MFVPGTKVRGFVDSGTRHPKNEREVEVEGDVDMENFFLFFTPA
jgi:hypothetical protein